MSSQATNRQKIKGIITLYQTFQFAKTQYFINTSTIIKINVVSEL
jgi:hypothetical protein